MPIEVINSLGQEKVTGATSPGVEVSYTAFTADVGCTATTEATANTVVTAAAFTAGGTESYWVEFFCPGYNQGNTTSGAVLYLDGSSVGIAWTHGSSIDPQGGCNFRVRVTPAAGSRTYSVRGFVGVGTLTFTAGAGGSGAKVPGFIRIVRV